MAVLSMSDGKLRRLEILWTSIVAVCHLLACAIA
jgi:hypothetical protein